MDRGPSSERVIEFLAKPWFHAVRGNHEQMLLNFMHDEDSPALLYAVNGGEWFIMLPEERQQQIAREIAKLPFAIEVETDDGLVGIVHAEVPDDDWGSLATNGYDGRMRESLLWARERIRERMTHNVSGVSKVYVGHTPVELYTTLGNVHYIDTGAVWGRGMSIVRIQ